MKKLRFLFLFLFLLVPVWVVFFFGYPVNIHSRVYKDAYPGLTNRCFRIGDTRELLKCYTVPLPKLKMTSLYEYFLEFREILGAGGILVVLTTYFAVWMVNTQEPKRG